jgi:transposase
MLELLWRKAMALVELNSKEIASLEILLTTSKDVRQLKRAQAILWLYEGDRVEEVAQRLRVSRQTVYNWSARFASRTDMSAELRVADSFRSGRPRTALEIIDSLIEAVIDLDPREFGYRSTIWTAPLLQQYLAKNHRVEVCDKSVRLAIDRLQLVWKRPRHNLALRSETWRQAKGG